MLHLALTLFCLISSTQGKQEASWPRWEERIVECSNGSRGFDCHLIAPNSRIVTDTSRYRCRREPMPKTKWNSLPKSETRLSCPLGCAPEADLSVIQKTPYNNSKCVKYFTYGKHRDPIGKEWYLWMVEPCEPSTLSTHCRFNDQLENQVIGDEKLKHKKKI